MAPIRALGAFLTRPGISRFSVALIQLKRLSLSRIARAAHLKQNF
jgi:hypothetical protein